MEIVEIFKDIPNYEGLYQVSNLGTVRSLDNTSNHWRGGSRLRKGRILRSRICKNGYSNVCLFSYGVKKTLRVHQLVAITFLNHVPNRHVIVVDHINNNRTDNRLENLQLITQRENVSKNNKGTSKYVGVYWSKKSNKWRSVITINNKRKHLGLFEKEEDAHIAYQKELKQIK